MLQRNAPRPLRGYATVVVALLFMLSFLPSVLAPPKVQAASPLIGPKSFYLALGDSLAFGFQPNLDFSDGYADDFWTNLKSHGEKELINLACNGETTDTMIHGGCVGALVRKVPYVGSQLQAASAFLHLHAGQVSPVTLDVGADDFLLTQDINLSNCTLSSSFASDLTNMDTNLVTVILPQLTAAMQINGQMTGDLLLLNYYDPFQNICPNLVPSFQVFNQHLAADASGFPLTLVDIFTAFGGAATPNPNICSFTWMCSHFATDLAVHATDTGYAVMAQAIEQTTGY